MNRSKGLGTSSDNLLAPLLKVIQYVMQNIINLVIDNKIIQVNLVDKY